MTVNTKARPQTLYPAATLREGQRASHWRFTLCMALSLTCFTLIWSPWRWLVFGGAGASVLFTVGMVFYAWRLAGVRRRMFTPRAPR